MMKQNTLIKIITLIFILFLWYFLSKVLSSSLFPGPLEVFSSFVVLTRDGILLKDIVWSIKRIFISLIFASFFGIILGLITSRIRLANQSIGAVMDYIKSISPIALVPFVILWFGIGEFSKVFPIILLISTVIWLNTDSGFRNVNKTYINAILSLGARKFDVIRYVMIPSAIPFIVNGIRMANAWAFIIIVATEMNGSIYGLGYHLFSYYQSFAIAKMMVNFLTLTSLAYTMDKLFVFLIKKNYNLLGEQNER